MPGRRLLAKRWAAVLKAARRRGWDCCARVRRAASGTSRPVSIVLVHGAFVDASGWKGVYDILTRDGYEVLIVQNPTITLAGRSVT